MPSAIASVKCHCKCQTPCAHYSTLTRHAETSVQYTQNQWKAIRQIWECLEGPKEPAKEARAHDHDPELTNMLMCLCMLVVMQDTSHISLYNMPMMHYLAIQGINTQSKALQAVFYYTPILASMSWLGKLDFIVMVIVIPG